MDERVANGDGGNAKKKQKIKPGSFQGLGLSHSTYKAVMKMGYKTPTPIQRKTIPTILDGQDVIAMARTGSGKTAAFLIPIIERLGKHSVSVGFRAVSLAPTRELAVQTAMFFRKLGKFCDLRCCLLVGGQAMETQFEHLANNPDIVIATPGRLMHHILEAEVSLSRVEVLVFDEADRLFELGFAEQLHKILEATPLSRQCLLFSATLPSQLVSFSRAGIKNPVFVRLDVETTLSENLDLWYCYARKDEKIAAAVNVLRYLCAKPATSTIMFVATRHHVEFFGVLLAKLGFSIAVVYGAMDMDCRTEQIARFRQRKASILVTTDVAARGIDVPLLDHVLNFDFPPSGKLFVHRAGRTARAGRSGLAVSLVTLEDLPYTVELMLFLGRKLRIADGEANTNALASSSTEPILGALPGLESDVEALTALLHDEGSEIQGLYKSMNASYGLYNKTRPSASKQSVARARTLLDECGGPAQLQQLIHPAFVQAVQGSSVKDNRKVAASAKETSNLIQVLRSFRPKAEKVGNVISTNAMRTMEAAKIDATQMVVSTDGRSTEKFACTPKISGNVSKRTETKDSSDPLKGSDDPPAEAPNRKKGAKRKLQEVSEPAVEKPKPVQARSGPRISKRARKNQHRTSDVGPLKSSAEELEDGGFDISVDGQKLRGGDETEEGSSKATKQKTPQFYLSIERDTTMDAKERGLEMEQYQIDLMPDDSNDIKKSKSVIRWDAKKKKYLPVMVSVDGRVVKGQQRTNESGQKVKGDAERSNIYKKWAQATNKRIQKSGEMEQSFSKARNRKEQQGAAKAALQAKTIEFDDQCSVKKPVVPYYGEVEAKYLTNKQKRVLKNREKKAKEGPVKISSEVAKEVKSLAQVQRERKTKDKKRTQGNSKLRQAKGKEIKEARKEKIQQKSQQHGARTKAKILVFEGTTPKRNKKQRGYQTI